MVYFYLFGSGLFIKVSYFCGFSMFKVFVTFCLPHEKHNFYNVNFSYTPKPRVILKTTGDSTS